MTHKLSKIFVKPSDCIKAVADLLAANKLAYPHLPPGVALVVDSGNRLLGIVTNGDIRRAFAKGLKVGDAVFQVMNKNPGVIETESVGPHVLSIVTDKIRAGTWPKDRLEKIIIVDSTRRVLDIVSFYDLVHSSDVRFKHIGVVGLGYVGLTLGLTLADLGFKVRGYDTNTATADAIKNKKPHFYEAGLGGLLNDHLGKNFKVVNDFQGENGCDVYFIAVGTPLDANQKPSMRYIESAAENLGKVLKHGDVVILRSTVPLGTTRNVVAPILERVSGMRPGEDFLIAFAPERTIEGKALEELRRLPQVIGGINRASCDLVQNIFSVLTNSTVLVDTLEEAEMVKLVNNTYRDVTFAFANEVSLIAQKWGIKTKRVIDAANYGYERSRVPMPSPGVGGYCLEKDPFIFIDSARAKGYEPKLFRDAREVSDMMIDSVSNQLISFLRTKKNSKVLILGFAFKGHPVTSDVRGSMTLRLVSELQKAKIKNIHGFDPAVCKEDIVRCGALHVKDLEKGFKDADAMVVMNNNLEFGEIDIRTLLAGARKPTLVFDTWSVCNADEVGKVKGVEYRCL